MKKTISAMLVAVLVISTVQVFAPKATRAQSGTEVQVINPLTGDKWFNFTIVDKSVGDNIIVNVTVADVVDLANWQIKFTWNSTLLTYVNIALPSDHVFSKSGKSMITPPPTVDPDSVIWGCTYINDPYWTFNGTGTLCQVTLEIIYGVGPTPPSEVSCNLALANKGADTFLLDGSGSDIPFTPRDGYYDYKWVLRDVAVTDVKVSTDKTYQGLIVDINVTVANLGTVNETFTATAYYEHNVISGQNVQDLTPSETRNLTFHWNTMSVPFCHTYTIEANATIVPFEIDVTNNGFVDGSVDVRMPGDVNGDGKVNMTDIVSVVDAFGSYLGHPRWNSDMDVNQDGRIDMSDIMIILLAFGKTC